MVEPTLRILHISDLHARGPREVEPWRRRRVLGEAWKQNLDEIVADGVAVDLVCCTGDIADRGLAVEYEQASSFFGEMLERLKVPTERFFGVPGNHDIARKVNEARWEDLRPLLLDMEPLPRSRWLARQGVPKRFQDAELDELLARQAAYWQWVETFGNAACLPKNSAHGRLGYRVPLRIRGNLVQVIGLDSSWLCGDDGDSGKLLLTEDQIARLATEAGVSLPGFRLALIHHPLSDLRDGESCRSLLAEHVDLLLRGHLHQQEIAEWMGPGESLRQIAAGCLYEGDQGNTWRNAFCLFDIKLDAKGRPKRYDVRLRGFSDRQKGFWFDDASLYREAPNGRLSWWRDAESVPPPALEGVRPPIFVGRQQELEALRQALLLPSSDLKPVAVCAVEGMPGVGKSYLVEKFARDSAASFPGGTVTIAIGPNEQRTAKELSNAWIRHLADRLKVVAAPEELPRRVRERLFSPPALLHIENVDNKACAEAAFTLAGWLRGCAVVATCRYAGLGAATGWQGIALDTLGEPAALELLEAELGAAGNAAERAARRLLVKELGGLPLALHLATGYLRVGGYTVDTFLAELRERVLDLEPADLGDTSRQKDPRRANLHKTFAISMDELKKQLGAGAEAIRALGYMPPGGVGRSLAQAMAGVSALDLSRLLDAAVRLSILVPLPEREGGAWRMHSLLGEWMRQGMAEDVVTGRMTGWFLERLPEEKAGEAWIEVGREMEAMEGWLGRVRGEDIGQVVEQAMAYAMLNGPFHVWQAFCERGLRECEDAQERSNLLWTLANVARSAGDLDRALEVAKQKQAHDKGRGAEREAAMAAGCRADVLSGRGELDEALRIRREEELPVFERLGDVRSRAVTLGKIADVLSGRGELDEALRIRREEQLPVYERLGDVRSRAVTLGKIADVLFARGELDEALRIRREEELPVFERLGDVRSRAVTLGKIADVFFARGELDEALLIRREEVLPVFERLGDMHSRAVTLGQIADVLSGRGELDEALRIRREEELPVYERLGDVRSRAVTLGQIADVLLVRGELDEALRIRREEELPVYERLGDVLSRAVTLGKIADVLSRRGELDEALRIRREEELPVLERLGDVRALLVGRTNLAINLLKRNASGDRAEATELLQLTYAEAVRLKLPEAAQIRRIQEAKELPTKP